MPGFPAIGKKSAFFGRENFFHVRPSIMSAHAIHKIRWMFSAWSVYCPQEEHNTAYWSQRNFFRISSTVKIFPLKCPASRQSVRSPHSSGEKIFFMCAPPLCRRMRSIKFAGCFRHGLLKSSSFQAPYSFNSTAISSGGILANCLRIAGTRERA